MIFEKLVNQFLAVLSEQNEEIIAMVPGSFKPPHKGHYEMIEHFSNISQKTLVVISDPQSEKSIRRTPSGKQVTAQEAREILEIDRSSSSIGATPQYSDNL